MIDESMYNTLKKFTEPCQGYDKLLSEVGYIEVESFSPTVCRITPQGELALREYEMYAERNRLEDDRYAKDTDRQIKIAITTLIFTIAGVAATVTGIVLGLLHII